MLFYLIGGTGNLGLSIAEEYKSERIKILRRNTYYNWGKTTGIKDVARFFKGEPNQAKTIFIASGLLDPKSSLHLLKEVNLILPKNVIEVATLTGANVMTFGTIMEVFGNTKNPYIQTKRELGNYVENIGSDCNTLVTHVRLHTLFGVSEPKSFMFIGQMVAALRSNTIFKMSEGNQLREYHHYHDVTKAIKLLQRLRIAGGFNLNHGMPLPLREVAEKVFESQNKLHLLDIGALGTPEGENFSRMFCKNDLLMKLQFRDPMTALNDYITDLLSN